MSRTLFVVEDELHCEIVGRFDDRSAAIAELHRFARITRDQEPS